MTKLCFELLLVMEENNELAITSLITEFGEEFEKLPVFESKKSDHYRVIEQNIPPNNYNPDNNRLRLIGDIQILTSEQKNSSVKFTTKNYEKGNRLYIEMSYEELEDFKVGITSDMISKGKFRKPIKIKECVMNEKSNVLFFYLQLFTEKNQNLIKMENIPCSKCREGQIEEVKCFSVCLPEMNSQLLPSNGIPEMNNHSSFLPIVGGKLIIPLVGTCPPSHFGLTNLYLLFELKDQNPSLSYSFEPLLVPFKKSSKKRSSNEETINSKNKRKVIKLDESQKTLHSTYSDYLQYLHQVPISLILPQRIFE